MIRRHDSTAFRSYSDLDGSTVTIILDEESDKLPSRQRPGIDVFLAGVKISIPGTRAISLLGFTDVGWTDDSDGRRKTFTTTLRKAMSR